jgi:16S rRNA processing protein RimM
LRIRPHTDQPERFGWIDQVFVGEITPVAYSVERARLHQGMVILKLAGCDNRDQADALRGQLLQIPLEEALPLAEGEYYLFQLVGLQIEAVGGELLGELVEILQTGANDVFVVRRPGSKTDLLLPDIPEVVLGIDLAAGRITVEIPPGLRDE